jgi:predicted acylesterase/phospholipase RssA
LAIAAIATSAVNCMFRADGRNLFALLTYDEKVSETPKNVVPFQLFASLENDALMPLERPSDVANCLTELTSQDLKAQGAKLLVDEFGSKEWARKSWDFVQQRACYSKLAENDKVLATYVLARVVADVWATARDATVTEAAADGIFSDATSALARVAVMLRQAHPNRTTQVTTDESRRLPALALSGGAANGAFSAGFLAELLSVRLRAVLPPRGRRDISAEERAQAMSESRFAALVGTSVGAVLSQILDLYYTDDPKLYADNRAFFDDCNSFWRNPIVVPTPDHLGQPDECFNGSQPEVGNMPPTITPEVVSAYPVQACAIRYLYKLTEVEEQDLICVPPGPVTNAVGVLGPSHPGLVRFDPMATNIVDPFVGQFSLAMMNNDVTRVDVAVETMQNQTLGLDERSCWSLPSSATPKGPLKAGSSENCLASGVMASLVLPFFAIPVRQTYSGFDPDGECGSWLDGGLRSGFPVLRALLMTRPNALEKAPPRLRVLAVNNGQMDGRAQVRSQGIHQVALNAIGQMSGQNQVYEVAAAQDESALRERAIAVLIAFRKNDPGAGGPAGDAGAAASADCRPDADAGCIPIVPATAVPLATDDDAVSGVWVPNEVPPSITSGAEYSFDKYIMRGLFTWGRRAALKRLTELLPAGPEKERKRRQLARWLGWSKIADAVEAEALYDRDGDATWKRWTAAYEHEECLPFHVARSRVGKRRITDRMPTCVDLKDPLAEPYFQCIAPASEVHR